MITKCNKQKSGFSVIATEELFNVSGGNSDGNATKYTFSDGSYMIVSNDGSFETKNYYQDGSEKKMDGMCADVSNAVPSNVNYNPNTGEITNPYTDSNSSNKNISYGGGSSSSRKS